MRLPGGNVHLTYCTNIHRGESWSETNDALQHLPEVKRQFAPDTRMGVGLRLSARAAEELEQNDALAAFQDFLRTHGLYVFTINGFPYGRFHGTRVKADVYQPDWRFPERLSYSNRLADILVRLLEDESDLDGSISTVPGTFRPVGQEPGVPALLLENLLQHTAHLWRLREETGRSIGVALEPEPMCYLETTAEAAEFFEERFYARAGVTRFAEITRLSRPGAEEALHRHIGVCFDVCHAAVEFEDSAASFARLAQSGIPVLKLQLSAALRIPQVNAQTVERLRRFDDGVYLHQVVEKRGDGRLIRFLDLEDAFAAAKTAMGHEWRVHCHVPVFEDDLPEFGTTQPMLREVLAAHRVAPLSQHLEVETYTFDVLPEELRGEDVTTSVARELAWVKKQLAP